ncbi:hypothetical protein GDO78_022825 [Eleutherodactylus coqui]|uniref:Uncharacterized protein n=3 Tax=Eleutherodactylus coqui TaxID=57060 RepID=A0A8J6JRG8_ELECQ|nr:hypothetical protein GDO78_022825 [Eleutherodactylus coqui]
MANKETMLTAEISAHASLPKTIEILSVEGSHPVAKIITMREGSYTQVIFQYPSDMDAAMKAVILAAFLYLTFQVGPISDVHSSDESDLATIGSDHGRQKKAVCCCRLCCWKKLCCALDGECYNGYCGFIVCLGYLCC